MLSWTRKSKKLIEDGKSGTSGGRDWKINIFHTYTQPTTLLLSYPITCVKYWTNTKKMLVLSLVYIIACVCFLL